MVTLNRFLASLGMTVWVSYNGSENRLAAGETILVPFPQKDQTVIPNEAKRNEESQVKAKRENEKI